MIVRKFKKGRTTNETVNIEAIPIRKKKPSLNTRDEFRNRDLTLKKIFMIFYLKTYRPKSKL